MQYKSQVSKKPYICFWLLFDIETLYLLYVLLSDINSFSPGVTYYMHSWTGSTLVQVMAWRRTGAQPLPEPMQTCQLDPQEQISVKSKSISKSLIRENAFKNVVCRMTAILPEGEELN